MEIFAFFTDQHHVILILLGALVVAFLGKQLGPAISAITKKAGDVNVSIKEEQDKRICRFSPEDCNAHKAEYQRSLKNERDIERLEARFKHMETVMYQSVGLILRALVKASLIDEKDIPKELT